MQTFLRALTAAAVFACAGAAWAQDSAPLKGPSGDDKSVPGETRKFGGPGGDRKERAAQMPVRHPMFMQALGILRGDKAGESVRLTAEQDEKIAGIDRDMKAKAEAFRAEHGEEIRGLVSKLTPEDKRRFAALLGQMGQPGRGGGEGAKGAGRPAAGQRKGVKRPNAERANKPAEGDDATMQTSDAAAAEQAREKLRTLMETAPRPEDAHKAIFGVLTEAQRPLVQTEIERMRKEMEQRAAEGGKQLDREKERAGRKLDKKEAEAMEGAAPTSIDDPRIPERMRERLKKLPEDQQQAALKRLWARLQVGKPKE
ncbi:MAG: hypothetical protein IT433_00360 [Phycisphaerales bacterium]|nr:hypothetical protein [Phycisphaerales bacterium]